MDANFWAAVSAIGQWVGAIATFIAVWVALRQVREAKESVKPKLDITWELSENKNQELLIVRAVNHKTIPLYVESVHANFLSTEHHKNLHVPAKLIESDVSTLIHPGNFISCTITLKELVILLHQTKFPKESTFTLDVVFLDSLGKPHSIELTCRWIEEETKMGLEVFQKLNGWEVFKGPNNLIMVERDF